MSRKIVFIPALFLSTLFAYNTSFSYLKNGSYNIQISNHRLELNYGLFDKQRVANISYYFNNKISTFLFGNKGMFGIGIARERNSNKVKILPLLSFKTYNNLITTQGYISDLNNYNIKISYNIKSIKLYDTPISNRNSLNINTNFYLGIRYSKILGKEFASPFVEVGLSF